MRTLINKKLNELELEVGKVEDLEYRLAQAQKDKETAEQVQEIMQKAAKLSQDHLASHLSAIVTQAVQAVIEKPYEFVCEFVERRGATEADLYLHMNGKKFDILGGTGGGLADVCSFSLKVAYLLLSNTDRSLVIDEVSRHINSSRQRENFAKVLKRLAQEFEIQMIINTTISELKEVADKIITLEQRDGKTKILE